MNAPWKPGMGNGRDIFQAFACDDASVSIIRSVAVEMGWQPEKVRNGGLRAAVQSLSVSASPQILFIDMSESIDPLNDINSLAEVCEPGTIVIAAGQINDVRLYRDLIASGIQDYLLKPLSVDQVRDAMMHAQASFMAPKADAGEARPHVSVAVIGTRGGVGASTFATSLAWELSENSGRSTALLDLDLHFGTNALAMDLEPGRGLIDAIENPSRIDGLFIERAMVRAGEKLAILSSEAPINQPMLTDGGAFHQLLEEFRSAFECTVMDLPRTMLIQYPQLVSDANVVAIVTDVTLAGARDTIRLLSWMRSNAPHAKIMVVADKMQQQTLEISRKDFEQSIEHKIDIALPYDARSAAQAARLGKTLAEVAKGGKLGQGVRGAVGKLFELTDSADDAASKKGGSLLDKLGDFRSLLSRKADPSRKADKAEKAVSAGGKPEKR